MSTISIPAGLSVVRFQMVSMTNQRVFASPFGGSEQVVDLLNDRWKISLTLAPMGETEGGILDGFLASLRGQVNTVSLGHYSRPNIRGTLSGTVLVNGAVSAGASSIALDGAAAGGTLKIGDLFSAGGLLLMAGADATANGSGQITVTLANRVRSAIADNAPVTLASPTGTFRCITPNAPVYSDGIASAVDLEFLEVVT